MHRDHAKGVTGATNLEILTERTSDHTTCPVPVQGVACSRGPISAPEEQRAYPYIFSLGTLIECKATKSLIVTAAESDPF